ncbi:hypothetical protein [uncultured Shewanella sp.]|nr:hypothetical protein [uncultured Shewanella sp.]
MALLLTEFRLRQRSDSQRSLFCVMSLREEIYQRIQSELSGTTVDDDSF